MLKKEKKPAGLLRKIFRCAGAVIVGVNMAGAFVPQSDEAFERSGLTSGDIRELTGARVHLAALGDPESYLFSMSTLSREFMSEVKNAPNTGYLQALAYKNPIFGYNGVVDRITFGLSGQIFPCTVLIPPNDITLDHIKESIPSINKNEIRNFPGTLKDYMKLIASHEVDHCNKFSFFSNRNKMELSADRASLDHFLKTGGNEAVARSYLNMRTMAAMSTALSAPDKLEPYMDAPGLYSRYFGGFKALTPDNAGRAFLSGASFIQSYAKQQNINPSSLYKSSNLRPLIDKALTDQDTQIPTTAREALRLYAEAYDFFTREPVPAMNLAMNP